MISTFDKSFAINVFEEAHKIPELRATNTKTNTIYRLQLTQTNMMESGVENVQTLKKFLYDYKFGDYIIAYEMHDIGSKMDLNFYTHSVFTKSVMKLLTKPLQFTLYCQA